MLVMRIAETVGKSVSEVLELSLEELSMWAAYFSIKYDAEKEAARKAKAKQPRAVRRGKRR